MNCTGAQSFQDPIEEQDECSVSGEAGAEDVGLETTKPEGVETGTGFLSTSGVGELADLQEALKATQLGATNDSGNIDMRGKIRRTHFWPIWFLTSIKFIVF